MTTRQELIEAAHHNWNINRGVDPEVMRDLGYDTPESLPDTIERVLGEKVVSRAAEVGSVPNTDTSLILHENETPQPTKFKDRPPARTVQDKAARDQGRRLELKPPPEWSPILRSAPDQSVTSRKQ